MFFSDGSEEFGQLVSAFLELVGVTEVNTVEVFNGVAAVFEDIVADEVAGPGGSLIVGGDNNPGLADRAVTDAIANIFHDVRHQILILVEVEQVAGIQIGALITREAGKPVEGFGRREHGVQGGINGAVGDGDELDADVQLIHRDCAGLGLDLIEVVAFLRQEVEELDGVGFVRRGVGTDVDAAGSGAAGSRSRLAAFLSRSRLGSRGGAGVVARGGAGVAAAARRKSARNHHGCQHTAKNFLFHFLNPPIAR